MPSGFLARFPDAVEKGRIRDGKFETKTGDAFGAVLVRIGGTPVVHLRVIAANAHRSENAHLLPPGEREAELWDHVSVSVLNEDRCPTWEEMVKVKDWFFRPEVCVVQYHPPKADNINYHPYCLHLWHHPDRPFPMPPKVAIAPQPGE